MENPAPKTTPPAAARPSPGGAETPAHPLDALLARLPGLVYRCRYDAARTVEFASAGARALLGLTPQELVRDGLGFDQLICPADRDRVRREIADQLAQHDTFACAYRVHSAAVLEQGRAVRDHHGKIVALEGYLGRAAGGGHAGPAALQFQQERSFSALNLLASGVAHDFSNVIAGIVGSAELIKMDGPANPPDGELLEQIFKAARHGENMIRQLKNFSHRSAGKRVLILLPPVIEESLELLRSTIPATVEMTRHIEQSCPAVLADAAQIQQIVTSLCMNVWHTFSSHQGRIEVGLDTCAVDAELAAAHPGLQAGPHVRLAVRSNGHSFSRGVLGRMFEPFACKQANGYNSGMELFNVQEIAHAHDGAATVENAPGGGTVFHLYFPVPENQMPARDGSA